VCVNVQIRDNRQFSSYDMSKAEHRGTGRSEGERSTAEVCTAFR